MPNGFVPKGVLNYGLVRSLALTILKFEVIQTYNLQREKDPV